MHRKKINSKRRTLNACNFLTRKQEILSNDMILNVFLWVFCLVLVFFPSSKSQAVPLPTPLDPAVARFETFVADDIEEQPNRITITQPDDLETRFGTRTLTDLNGNTRTATSNTQVTVRGGNAPEVTASARHAVGPGGPVFASNSQADVRLRYSFRLNPTDSVQNLLAFLGLIPIDLDISSGVQVSVEGPNNSPSRLQAAAVNFVYLGQLLEFNSFNSDDLIFTSSVSTSPNNTGGPGVPFTFEEKDLEIPFGEEYDILKRSRVVARASNIGGQTPIGTSAFANAVLDPVITISQERFNERYGSVCLEVLMSQCPSVSSLFEIQYSPGIEQGQSPVIQLPEPSSFALIAAGLAGLGLAIRRRRQQ